MPKAGYHAVRWLRMRSADQRGGQERPADGLNRNASTMAVQMDQHLEWMRVHNRTESGSNSRRAELTYFLRWAEERGLFQAEQITRSILESYQRYLYRYRKKNGRPLSVRSQYGRLDSLRLFFSWLCRQRMLEANPASELEMPRFGRPLPQDTLSIKEVEATLSVPDINDPLGLRDRAVLELLYSTGIRRGELIRLAVSDLNLDNHTLFIRQGKGHKDRIVPVGRRAMSWMEKYLNDVRPLLAGSPDENSLFLSGYGQGFNPDVLSRVAGDYIRKADIGRTKGGCHAFRHACATHMLEGGADIRYIQQLLGHETLDTTAIYTRVSIKQLKAVHAQTHPAETGETNAHESEAPH